MTRKFIVTIEYPDCDYIATEEFVDCINLFFDQNIMDGEKGRLKTKVEEVNSDWICYKVK